MYQFSAMAGLGQTAGGVLLPRVVDTLAMPIDTYIAAQREVSQYTTSQMAWEKNPCILPPPDALLELLNREWLNDAPNGGQKIVWNALRAHGIDIYPPSGRRKAVDQRRQLWGAVSALKRGRPDPMWIIDAHRKGLLPVETDLWHSLAHLGCEPQEFIDLIDTLQARAGIPEILGAVAEKRPGSENWRTLLKEAGTYFGLWEDKIPWLTQPPAIGDALAMMNRGVADDNDLARWLNWHRQTDDGMFARYKELQKGVPGVADLNMFGIRHSWQPELVERYGYYREFPERLREWYGKLGLDYGVGFNALTDRGVREVTLADAYWASHWHVLPLNQAFMAYQRFQPDLVRRFQTDNPNLTPFTRDDLNIHMRQADFPPGVREWLTALAHPVLGRRDINWGSQFLHWDRAEMQSRFRLLGYTTDDAAALAQIAEARETYRSQAWIRSVETRAHQSTVKMIEGLYTDGTIDRPFALRQLSEAGLSDSLSVQLLDIADFAVERALVRASVSATSRDFLAGVLSRAEAETQLRRIGITDYRVGNYLAAWSIQRSARRKRLETAKVAGMVTAGLLSPEEARARLANLQWSDPDATLLLAEAEGKLARRMAADQKSAETGARQRAKELERLAKDAEAQSKKLRAEANRIAPRSSVTAWLRDGIIDDDTFRSMLRERGYDDESIERYLKDAKAPRPRPPRPSPTTPPWPRPSGSAHPAQARLLKWYNDGVISLEDYRHALSDLGYSDYDVARFIIDARGSTNGAPLPPAPG